MIHFIANKWVHFLVLFGLLMGAVYFSGSSHDLRKRLQYATFDTYNKMKPREASDRIAIIDLDEESIKELGQWPWPRNVMAQMVERLRAYGANVIAFDIVFAESDRTSPARVAQTLPDDAQYSAVKEALAHLPDNDAVFAKAIEEAGNVVMGFTRARPEETLRTPYLSAKPMLMIKDKTPFFENTFSAPGVAENLPEFSMAAAGNGSFMATPDIDGIIRQVSLFVKYPPEKMMGIEPELYPMLGVEALRVDENKKSRLMIKNAKDQSAIGTDYVLQIAKWEVPIESDSKLWVYYRDIKDDEYISARRLFDDAQTEKIRNQVNGKIVFIGTSAEGLRDIRSTPLDIFVPGVEVHVNVAEQILQGKFLIRPDIVVGVEAAVIAAAGLLIIICAPFANAILLGILTSSLMGSMFILSWMGFRDFGVLLDPVYPGICLSFLFLVSSLFSYIRSEAERRRVRTAFGLYISPAFMNELTKNPEKLKLGGEVRDLTVMFSDIRNFTSISEQLSPEELIVLMNDFLTPMSDLVMENRGTIDKYMGDAMMAFWNAPLDDEDHARHACLAALKMQEALAPVNDALKLRAEKEGRTAILLKAGIGLNTGPCSVGNMGSRQRFAYSALGDAVNLASRLESQTKFYGVNIIAGEETKALAPDLGFLELDMIRVKGKDKPVRIYALQGDENWIGANTEWHSAHESMIAKYRMQDFDSAYQNMVLARKVAGGVLEKCYDLYAQRITSFMRNPPQKDWDGVYTAQEK
jgi:adenylate cyclase